MFFSLKVLHKNKEKKVWITFIEIIHWELVLYLNFSSIIVSRYKHEKQNYNQRQKSSKYNAGGKSEWLFSFHIYNSKGYLTKLQWLWSSSHIFFLLRPHLDFDLWIEADQGL